MKQLDTQLESTTARMKELLVSVSQINNDLSSSAKNYKDLVDVIKTYQGKLRQVPPVLSEYEKLLRQQEELNARLTKEYGEQARQMAILREQVRQNSRENQLAAKATLAHANSIEAMRVKLAQMKAEWATLDTSSDQFKKMTDDIAKLNAEILKNEQAIGVHGRNVGNYSSAFNGLSFSISQVARELPSLTISAGQFFLAISNNLPMLVDELQRAREANAALRKEGQATVPVWRQLAKGLLSWQTLMVVGITLLTAYSDKIGKWVLNLFAGKEAVDAFVEAQKRLNEASVEGAKNAQEELLRLRLLRETAENTAKSNEERGRAVEELQKLYPGYLGNLDREKILSGEVAGAYQRLSTDILNAAKAKAVFDKAVKASQEALDLEKEYRDLAKESPVFNMFPEDDEGFIGQLRKELAQQEKIQAAQNEAAAMFGRQTSYVPPIVNNINKIISAYDKWKNKAKETDELIKSIDWGEMTVMQNVNDNSKEASDLLDKERQARLQYYELIYKDQAEKNKAIVEDERLSFKDREKALDEFVAAQLKSLKKQKEAELEALGGEGTNNQRLLIEAKYNSEIKKIWTERAKIWDELKSDDMQDSINNMQMSLSFNLESISRKETEAQNALSDLYLSGEINQEEYERRKLQTTRDYATQRFNAELEGLNEILNMEGLTQEQKAKIDEEYGKAEREYQQWLLEQENADYDKAMKEKEEMDRLYAQKKRELLQGVFDFAVALLERDLENQLNKLEDESEANQEWADEEAERIDRLEESGAISKEQADARKAAIDDQAQARETQIEEKRKELQRKQAQYQKAESLMSIAFSTAKAIMAAWTNPWAAPALIPTIIAAGAAQMAAVVATPIPEYAEGTDDHPGGLAVVGDGGRSEMVISGGKIYKTPAVDTLVDLPRHAVVLPDFGAAAERLPEMPQVNSVVNVDNSKLEALSKENGKLLRQLIRRMEINAKNEIYARELERLRPTKRRSI